MTEERLRAYLKIKAGEQYHAIGRDFGSDALHLTETLMLGFGLKSLNRSADEETAVYLANAVWRRRSGTENKGIEINVEGVLPTFTYQTLDGTTEKLIRPPTVEERNDTSNRKKMFTHEFPTGKYPNLIETPLTTQILSAVSAIHRPYPHAPTFENPDPWAMHLRLRGHLIDSMIDTAVLTDRKKMQYILSRNYVSI